jgi:plasmid replication initiation protein
MTQKKTQKTDLLVQANSMVEGSYRMTPTEMRLVKYAFVQFRENNLGLFPDLPIVIQVRDFCRFFGMTEGDGYNQVKEATTRLLTRQFTWRDIFISDSGKKSIQVTTSNWISERSYIDNEGIVKIIFTPAVIRQITRVDTEFLKYEIKQITNLGSSYSIRMYELLGQYKAIGERMFAVDELREILQIGDKHRAYGQFKLKVLMPAVDEINEKTDSSVWFEEEKTGRKITCLNFKIEQKTPAKAKSTRKKITRAEAERMANVGESWAQLLARIGKDYIVV